MKRQSIDLEKIFANHLICIQGDTTQWKRVSVWGRRVGFALCCVNADHPLCSPCFVCLQWASGSIVWAVGHLVSHNRVPSHPTSPFLQKGSAEVPVASASALRSCKPWAILFYLCFSILSVEWDDKHTVGSCRMPLNPWWEPPSQPPAPASYWHGDQVPDPMRGTGWSPHLCRLLAECPCPLCPYTPLPPVLSMPEPFQHCHGNCHGKTWLFWKNYGF